jgi:hypothetical protein
MSPLLSLDEICAWMDQLHGDAEAAIAESRWLRLKSAALCGRIHRDRQLATNPPKRPSVLA